MNSCRSTAISILCSRVSTRWPMDSTAVSIRSRTSRSGAESRRSVVECLQDLLQRRVKELLLSRNSTAS